MSWNLIHSLSTGGAELRLIAFDGKTTTTTLT